MINLKQSQSQRITFVMVDAAGAEVAGLADTFTVNISKNGGAFAPSAGTKAEIGSGWYTYILTAAETNTVGTLSIRVTGAGCAQQNLEYVVVTRQSAAEFTYTVTNSVTGLPIEDVDVWITIDIGGGNIIWTGTTDGNGVAKDVDHLRPRLDAGTYYFWSSHPSYTFTNPDTEVVV